jgi:hypothetical protein
MDPTDPVDVIESRVPTDTDRDEGRGPSGLPATTLSLGSGLLEVSRSVEAPFGHSITRFGSGDLAA